jgi:ornithine cyclodeaminase/alanine dehydrogenase-like protein (mu-crystallin family)
MCLYLQAIAERQQNELKAVYAEEARHRRAQQRMQRRLLEASAATASLDDLAKRAEAVVLASTELQHLFDVQWQRVATSPESRASFRNLMADLQAQRRW